MVIAGNHDMCLDDDYVASLNYRSYNQGWHDNTNQKQEYLMKQYKVRHPRELLSNCIYLQDEMVEIAGIKIYGSPW